MFSFPRKNKGLLLCTFKCLFSFSSLSVQTSVYSVGPYIEPSHLYHSPLQRFEVVNRIFEHNATETGTPWIYSTWQHFLLCLLFIFQQLLMLYLEHFGSFFSMSKYWDNIYIFSFSVDPKSLLLVTCMKPEQRVFFQFSLTGIELLFCSQNLLLVPSSPGLPSIPTGPEGPTDPTSPAGPGNPGSPGGPTQNYEDM